MEISSHECCRKNTNIEWKWVPTKRRLSPSHPLFEEGNVLCSLDYAQIPIEASSSDHPPARLPDFACQIGICKQTFNTVLAYELHYNSVHRHVCSQCHRFFPTNRLLDIHLLEWHDTMFELLAAKQNMYQCLLEKCDLKFSLEKERKEHMIKTHKYPANFRFNRPRKQQKKKGAGARHQQEEAMDVCPGARQGDKSTMDTDTNPPVKSTAEAKSVAKPIKFSYKVPESLTFGQGIRRGFVRPAKQSKKKTSKKHWHQKVEDTVDTSVKIEDVQMDDLNRALDET